MRASADAAKRKSADVEEFRSEAAFSLGVFTALAIAMLLFGAF
jgi:hypothetical protein